MRLLLNVHFVIKHSHYIRVKRMAPFFKLAAAGHGQMVKRYLKIRRPSGLSHGQNLWQGVPGDRAK